MPAKQRKIAGRFPDDNLAVKRILQLLRCRRRKRRITVIGRKGAEFVLMCQNKFQALFKCVPQTHAPAYGISFRQRICQDRMSEAVPCIFYIRIIRQFQQKIAPFANRVPVFFRAEILSVRKEGKQSQ